MSWSIYKIGTKETIKRVVQESKGYGDPLQHDLAMICITKLLDSIPGNPSMILDASGHHEVFKNSDDFIDIKAQGNFRIDLKYSGV